MKLSDLITGYCPDHYSIHRPFIIAEAGVNHEGDMGLARRLIEEAKPRSVAALAELTGRQPGNLSRTLRTMSNYGFVEMRRVKREVMPIAKATRFRIVA